MGIHGQLVRGDLLPHLHLPQNSFLSCHSVQPTMEREESIIHFLDKLFL